MKNRVVQGFEIAIFMAIRQSKRLPKSYFMEVVDLDGRKTTVDDLGHIFSTYEAAESYARFYRKMYDKQYVFKVIGRREIANYDTSAC